MNFLTRSKFKKYLVLALVPFLMAAAAHKFYVSVTKVEFSEKDSVFQITTRIFIDDLDALLAARYEVEAGLATEKEVDNSNQLISEYLRSKLEIKLNGEVLDYRFLGKEYRDDLVVCYLESTAIDISTISTIEVRNDVLTELFEEQQNVVHIYIGNTRKSFILFRENNKGMLNL